jgi:hypothetical protein
MPEIYYYDYYLALVRLVEHGWLEDRDPASSIPTGVPSLQWQSGFSGGTGSTTFEDRVTNVSILCYYSHHPANHPRESLFRYNWPFAKPRPP